jgi:hypothetical protein
MLVYLADARWMAALSDHELRLARRQSMDNGEQSASRIAAVRRDDRVSVLFSSSGTTLTPRTVTIRRRCALFEDAQTKDWFYPIVLCVTPEKMVTFSSDRMRQYWRGGAKSD